jgi:O-antigen ligase/type II secretory pathway pseudopilin PulG
MESGKKMGPSRALAARAFGILGLAAATAILVSVPAVLDPDVLIENGALAYHPLKFRVLMVLSGALLVALVGVIVLDREPLGVPVLIPALAFLGVSALSTLFSEDRMHSLFGDRNDGLLSLAAGVLLFYATARILDSPLRVRVFLAAGVTSAVLISAFGISQNYGLDMLSGWLVPWYTDFGRSFSTVGNPLTLAAYLTLMAGAAVALSFKAGSRVGRVTWLIASAVIGACWLYTDARGAVLGVGVALPVVLWLAHRRMGTIKPLLAPLAALIVSTVAAVGASAAFGNLSLSVPLLAILAAYLIFVGALVLWLSWRERVAARSGRGDDDGGRRQRRRSRNLLVSLGILAAVAALAIGVAGALGKLPLPDVRAADDRGLTSLELRTYIWRETVPLILRRPLLGHGPDNFGRAFYRNTDRESKAFQKANNGTVVGVDKAHNDLLQVTATTGLLGLAAYLWIFVAYFRNAYRRGGWPLIALSGAVLAYILQLQTVFPSLDTSVAFWGLLGASVAVMRLHDRESGEETAAESGVETALMTAGTARAYELLAVAVVAGFLVAIAVPTFLEQREKSGNLAQNALAGDVSKTILVYKIAYLRTGAYPEAGVYTKEHPLKAGRGLEFRPPATTTIITTNSPDGFTVEGRSTTLAGTFTRSYDSITRKHTPPLPLLKPREDGRASP